MKVILIFESRADRKNMIPGPNEQVFIEAHDESGTSIDVGEWAADGEHETLTIDCDTLCLNDHARLVQKLDDCTAIAISPGNGDVNDYLRGMANGLLLAQSIFKGGEPKYIEHCRPVVFDFAMSADAAEKICDCMDNNLCSWDAVGEPSPKATEFFETAKKLRDLLQAHKKSA